MAFLMSFETARNLDKKKKKNKSRIDFEKGGKSDTVIKPLVVLILALMQSAHLMITKKFD